MVSLRTLQVFFIVVDLRTFQSLLYIANDHNLTKLIHFNNNNNREIEELMPCFISPTTFLELFHLLLDLPLVVTALERYTDESEDRGNSDLYCNFRYHINSMKTKENNLSCL